MKEASFIATALALALAVLLSLTGCSTNWFSASTETCYEAGTTKFCYWSAKNQENLKAKISFYPDTTLKDLDIQTTATTAESAIAAASAGLAAMAEAINRLIPLLEKAAMVGGS